LIRLIWIAGAPSIRAVDEVSQPIKTQYQKMVGKKIIEITKIINIHLICCLLGALLSFEAAYL
jgi:hypothetical protein